jgi:hypothetical protein
VGQEVAWLIYNENGRKIVMLETIHAGAAGADLRVVLRRATL